MAGERLPHSQSPNSSSLIETAGAKQEHEDGSRAADGFRGRALNDEVRQTGKGGKLRLSRLALFRKKPYDRPVHPGALDRPLPSSLNGPRPSLPSWLVDSASNLIVSSASYLFESFFKRRRTLWIDNGMHSTARMNSADVEHIEGFLPPSDNFENGNVPPLQDPVLETCCDKAEGKDSDLARVEGILKQRLLSREEVKRLTDVLRNRTSGGQVVGSNLEAYRWQDKTQQVEAEPNPVQLAKAYMGERTSTERTSNCVSTNPQWQSTPYRYGEGAGPSSIKRIKEEVHERSSMKPPKSGLASAERMLKRRLIADEEDNVISRGPSRRVRQKMTIMPNTSPYIRRVTAASGLRTSSALPLQLSERTEKVDEALEEPMLPAKGMRVEEPAVVVSCNDVDPPASLKARENLEAFSKKDALVLPMSGDIDKSNFKSAVEHVEHMPSKATKNSATGLLAASHSELPTATPERSKGFHMSAFFEDSSSDEESGPSVKVPTSSEAQWPELSISQGAPQEKVPISSEAQRPGLSISNGALQEITQEPFVPITNDGSLSSAPEFSKKASPTLLQPRNAIGPSSSNFESSALSQATYSSESPSTLTSTLAMGNSIPLLSNLKPLPVVSHAPPATDKDLPLFTPSASERAPSSVVLSMPPISASPPGPATLPATSVSFSVAGATTVAVAPSLSVAEVEWPSLSQKGAAAEVAAAEESGFSPAAASSPAITKATKTSSVVAPSFIALAAAPNSTAALTSTAALVPSVGSVVSSVSMPANVPAIFQATTGGSQMDSVTPVDSFLKAASGVTFTSGSPGADKQAEADTMATDPMTEEPDSSFATPSASPFLFGSVSTASTSLGQMPSFGSNATSTSLFSFPMPSSAPSGAAASSAQFPFSSQSSSAAGQLFTFGASGTSSANPFSMNTQSSFSFGSSASSSASPVFTATSSAPITFPATPAATSFQFGAPSSSMSSTSMFEAQMTPTASGFAAPAGQSNASAFVFSAPPTSSGTLTSPSFQFGGAGTSGSSFGGQSFAFGGQSALTASNPFAQSGASNAAPFQFGTSAATPSQSVFPSGATTPSPSFGAQQPSGSPFPFTFGAQPAAQPTGQPFSFGGQPLPAAPVQSPFGLSGAPGQNAFPSAGASGMDFGGGFSLGPAGGEKSGRKFIKAKRIGGAKRGK